MLSGQLGVLSSRITQDQIIVLKELVKEGQGRFNRGSKVIQTLFYRLFKKYMI